MADLHVDNQLLPAANHAALRRDQEDSATALVEALSHVKVVLAESGSDDDLIKSVDKFLRFVKNHQTLKYRFAEAFRKETAQVLCDCFFKLKNKSSPTLRLRVLNVTKFMLSKNWQRLGDFSLDWEPFWNEAMDLLHRNERYETTCSETALTDFAKALSSFIMDCRHYFNVYSSSAPSELGNLVEKALASLADLRSPHSTEGVLLLSACLPTDYKNWDAILPIIVEKWSAVDHNMDWDYCWVKVLCRARKHSRSFNWVPLAPFLLTKLRLLLNLPSGVHQKVIRGHSYPRAFSPFYVHFFINNKEMHRDTTIKMAKLLMRIVLQDENMKPAELLSLSLPKRSVEQLEVLNLSFLGFNSGDKSVSSSAVELALFVQSLRTYFHPSNSGDFVFQIANFVLSLVRQLCKLVSSKLASSLLPDIPSVAVHWPTVHYLMGIVLSITIEGLYAKNAAASRTFLIAMKHLVSLQPLFAHALLPPMLYTLDASTMSPAGHALITMQALSSCFHTLLYPNPVVLQYLPDLLRLSLPGLDASDASKTSITLDLYANILSRLPITAESVVKFANFPSYTAIAEGKSIADVEGVSNGVFEGQLSAVLAFITEEWAMAFVERVFVLINSLEAKVKGVKISPIISNISACMGLLLQAVSVDLTVRQTVVDNIVTFVLTKAPLHTTKACAKLFDSIGNTTPSAVFSILQKILVPEEMDVQKSSAEKVAFRLVVAGGCLRYAQTSNTAACLGIIEPVLLTNAMVYMNHDEKIVRKAFAKFAKDLFRGSMAVYPVFVKPMLSHQTVLGEPAISGSSDIHWHIPEGTSLSRVLQSFRQLSDLCFDNIRGVLDKAIGDDGSSADSAPNSKKSEELLGNSLMVVKKILRGAAELLGDAMPEDVDRIDPNEKLVYTTRQLIHSSLPEADVEYVVNYRNHVLSLLVELQEKLAKIPKESSWNAMRDNIFIVKQWLKIVEIIFNKRMANLKDIDGSKKWLTYGRQIATSMIALETYKLFKQKLPDALYQDTTNLPDALQTMKLGDKLKNILYWKYHNVDTNATSCVAWLQEVIRSKQLAFASCRACISTISTRKCAEDMETDCAPNTVVTLEDNMYNVDIFDTKNVFLRAVWHILDLSRHEYDTIRPVARKTFHNIVSKLSFKLNVILFNLIKLLHIPNATYYQTASTLVVLNHSKNINKIAQNAHLKIPLLQSFQNIYQTAMGLVEKDKAEKIMASFGEIFINYAFRWIHRSTNIDLLIVNVIKPFVDKAATNGIMSSNLRMACFQLYLLLHVLGTHILQYSSQFVSITKIVLEVISTQHGQPTQAIAVAALCRIAELATINKNATAESWFCELQGMFSADLRGAWKMLLLGFCRSHPKCEEGQSSQWSSGIDQVIQASGFLRITKPRRLSNKYYDQNIYSTLFRRDIALAMYTLLDSRLLNLYDGVAVSVEKLSALLDVSKDIATTSETEQHAANTTRSEIFCGILKAVKDKILPDADGALLSILKAYFLEQTESISMDYCKDWQEALCLAYDSVVDSTGDPLIQHALEAFATNLRTIILPVDASATGAGDQMEVDASASTVRSLDEGFARQGKIFMFTSALLQANYISNLLAADGSKTYPVAASVLSTLAASGSTLAIIYSSSRAELSSIVNTLLRCFSTDAAVVNEQFQIVSKKLLQYVDGTNDTEYGAVVRKTVVEEVCMIYSVTLMRLTLNQSMTQLIAMQPAIVHGITHPDTELSRVSSEALKFFSFAVVPSSTVRSNADYLAVYLAKTAQLSKHSSWKVRECALKGSVGLMMQNWNAMTNDERKLLKDIYAETLLDSQLEVQAAAQSAMVAYLSYKTLKEMKTITEAYVRNSESFLTRERNRRKLMKDNPSAPQEKPDKAYLNTVHMMACVILTYPYDLPSFVPPLLSSFVRHANSDILKSVISKTVQSFKRTHQDRWEQEYKKEFSVDQLEALQGAGAAHYFS